MTVRDRVGRVRHVALKVHGGPLSRAAFSGVLPPTAKLTRFDGAHGLVRVLHRDRDALQAFLDGLKKVGSRDVRVETLRTSGSLRKAAEALPRDSPAAKREGKRREKEPPGAGVKKGAPPSSRGPSRT